MSSFPVLNNRPIDQWKVTELKDELRKRKLPVKGLKDELVRRLFDSIQSEIAADEEKIVNDAAKDVEVDAAINQAPEKQNIGGEHGIPVATDAKVSQKATVSIMEVSEETAHPITQEATVVAEVSQEDVVAAVLPSEGAPAVNAVAIDEAPLSEATPAKGEEPESVARESTIVKEVHPDAEGNTEPAVEKTPEVGTGEKIVDDDVTGTDFNSDVNEAGKIQEQEVEPAYVDALASDADPMDADVAAAPKNNDEESLLPKNDSNDDALMYDEESKDSKLMSEDSKPILSKPNDQVPEVSPELGSQVKCELISNDNIPINQKNNIKDNLNADNFDLELEVKPEMVKPSSSIPSVGGDLQPLDDEKELVKNQSSLEEIDSTTNVDSYKKEDSPEGGSPEKLNLDRSSGDESMEEDVVESKQVESNIKSDLRGKTEVSSGHMVKEVTLPDSLVEGSSVDTKEVVAEEKPATLIEKRKLEAQDIVANTEPIKRQRRWNADNVKVAERQTSNLSDSDAHKDVFQPALRRSFGRTDSTASGDSPKERIVPPHQKPATTSLRIDRFVRPFTLKAVQELLGKTGSVCGFWMDHIKTHCYVTYSSVEEAVATRNAVYNLQWPPNNGNHLVAEFVDPQEVKLKLEPPPLSAAPISPSTATSSRAPQAQANQTVPHQVGAPKEQLPPPPPLAKPPTSGQGSVRDRHPPTPKKPEPPVVTLDDLFKKTKTSPRIYYLPLSEEEVAAKHAAHGKGKKE